MTTIETYRAGLDLSQSTMKAFYMSMNISKNLLAQNPSGLTLSVGSSNPCIFSDPAYKVELGRAEKEIGASIQSNPYAMIYDPVGVKIATQISLNPEKTLAQAKNDRLDAVEAYANKYRFEITSLSFTDDGVDIHVADYTNMQQTSLAGLCVPGIILKSVAWNELGIENEVGELQDGYVFLNHHIFGEIKLSTDNQTALNAELDRIHQMTSDWVAANGDEPLLSGDNYKLTSYNTVDWGVSQHNLLAGTGLNDAQFVSTEKLVQSFLEQYDVIVAQKEKDLQMLAEYYSKENILERALKAGLDDEELLNIIAEAQSAYGQKRMDAIRVRGDINLNYGTKEEQLASYLNTQVSWQMNRVFPSDNPMDTANSLATAALGGTNKIRFGTLEMSYQDYLHLESKLQQVFDGFRKQFNNGSSGADPYDVAQEQIDTVNRLRDDFGPKFGNILAHWFNQAQQQLFKSFEAYHNQFDIGRPHVYDWSDIPRIRM